MDDDNLKIQNSNRIDELEGCYYQIPEYVYYRIPVDYTVGSRFTFKKLVIAGISLFIFVSIIKYMSEVGFKIEVCCAMFPLLLITSAVFLSSVLPKDPRVTKDSLIVEAEVVDVEIRRSGRYTFHVATLYIPSADKKVKVYFGQSVTAGRYVVIVRQKNTLTFIKMHNNYIPEYISLNR